MTDTTVVLGASALSAIAQGVAGLEPLLYGAKVQIMPDGGLEVGSQEALTAIDALRIEVEAAFPPALRQRIEAGSGLPFAVFFGHVLAWWHPHSRYTGFLRALVDRASVHGVHLVIHWNEGRSLPPVESRPGADALVIAGLIGLTLAMGASHFFPRQPLLGFLLVGAGLVAGRLYQRWKMVRRCGDPLCREVLPRGSKRCPSCGATVGAPLVFG